MTSQYFPYKLDGYFSDDGQHFTLDEDFVFIDGEKGTFITVPAGFQTDFNSVPRALWGYFPPWQYPEAGVIHDWLYRHPGQYNRGDCDDIHRRILDIKGCRWSKRQIAWLGLRAGGSIPWNRYREAEKVSNSSPTNTGENGKLGK